MPQRHQRPRQAFKNGFGEEATTRVNFLEWILGRLGNAIKKTMDISRSPKQNGQNIIVGMDFGRKPKRGGQRSLHSRINVSISRGFWHSGPTNSETFPEMDKLMISPPPSLRALSSPPLVPMPHLVPSAQHVSIVVVMFFAVWVVVSSFSRETFSSEHNSCVLKW